MVINDRLAMARTSSRASASAASSPTSSAPSHPIGGFSTLSTSQRRPTSRSRSSKKKSLKPALVDRRTQGMRDTCTYRSAALGAAGTSAKASGASPTTGPSRTVGVSPATPSAGSWRREVHPSSVPLRRPVGIIGLVSTTTDIIRGRAATVVEAVRRDEVGVYRMIKQLVATTIKEYRGRFLHELIQNGFDAHPEGSRDGKIAVHFHEAEGEHGVLYVANGGRPLSESNFLRMASLGDSDKPIGVGIGNKGVGFKSVFQICDVPEVYSSGGSTTIPASQASPSGSARRRPERHLDPDDPLRAKLESELSLSLLTVPLDVIPPTVADFRREGFVTVLRLPASSDRAATEIRERIDRLLASRSPIMLFLDRLTSLSIQTSSGTSPDGLETPTRTGRRPSPGHSERRDNYLLFEGVVPHADLFAALKEAVTRGHWTSDGSSGAPRPSVSVAVGDGWAVPNPAPFTFLPMGEAATSPLGGHINAPFVTDFARLGLDSSSQSIGSCCAASPRCAWARRSASSPRTGMPAPSWTSLLWNPDSLQWITRRSSDPAREPRRFHPAPHRR